MKFLAMYLDPQGMPRAWGRAATRLVAVARADQELASYRKSKEGVDDEAAKAEYRLKVKRE